MVLADALWYAREQGATHLIDMATLTGAMVLAMGDLYAGVYANDDAWRDQIVEAANAAGDHLWPIPLHRRYRRYVNSNFADMKNASILREGSPALAAEFLREFSGRGALGAHRPRRAGVRPPLARRLHRRSGGYWVRRATDRRARPAPRYVNFDLSPEHELIRDTVRAFALEKVAPVAEELDREHRFPYELVAEMSELGLMGIPIPEEYGGGGRRHALVCDRGRGADADRLVGGDHGRGAHLARDDADLPVRDGGAEAGMAPRSRLGQEARRVRADRAGRRIRRRARPARPPSSATEQWVIDGAKMFITNAGTDISACVTITARTGENEVSNIVVPNGTPGYEISAPMQKLGWRASDTRELSFQGAAVPEGNLLGPRGDGFKQFLEILDGGRISVASMGVGLAQGAYDLAYAYSLERQQFGKPIASFQAVQFQLADLATDIEAGRALVYRAAWLKDEGRPFALAAAQAKLYTGLLSNRAANIALQIHGGYGFMDEFAISRIYRDQKILEIGEGTNEVQRMVIAKHLGLPAS